MHVRLPRSSAISRGGPRSSNLGDCAGVGQEARQNKLRRKDASISDPRNDPQSDPRREVTHEMANCQLGAQTPTPISYLPWYAINICKTVRLRFSCSPTPIEHSPSQLSKTKPGSGAMARAFCARSCGAQPQTQTCGTCIWLCVCLPIGLSACLSVCLPACTSVCLSARPPAPWTCVLIIRIRWRAS